MPSAISPFVQTHSKSLQDFPSWLEFVQQYFWIYNVFFSHGGKGSKQIPRQRIQMTNPTGAQPAEEWRAWPLKNTSLSGSVWGEDVQVPQSPYGQSCAVSLCRIPKDCTSALSSRPLSIRSNVRGKSQPESHFPDHKV